jgi:hypothetical protein
VEIIYGTPPERPIADHGAGLFNEARLEITNSIVAGNSGGNLSNWASMISRGQNLSTGDPLLAPLGNYGGPTPTMAVLPESPARNAAVGPVSPTDQRNYPRPVGPPDIGAFEADIETDNGPGNEAGYHMWAMENLPGDLDRQFGSDTDQDGHSNGVEYAMRSNPFQPSRTLLSFAHATVLGQTGRAIRFPYRPAASDLIYTVERTFDITQPDPWQEILRLDLGAGSLTESSGVTSIFDPLTGRATVFDINVSAPTVYWRLRIGLNTPE